MRFAIQNNSRIEATPGARGICPGCSDDLVAKCGERRTWHWAHKGRIHCDPWWENETEWHRQWKSNFPVEWQEIAARDEHGELHIADIKSRHGIVVEFQHSYLKPEEARKRTAFHNPMFWVIDATRRTNELERFETAKEDGIVHRTKDGIVNQLWPHSSRLLKEWTQLGVIVAFDFGRETVWLMRWIQDGSVYGFDYPKSKLIADITEGNQIPNVVFGKPVLYGNRRRRRF